MNNMVPIANPMSGIGLDSKAKKLIEKFQPEVLQRPSPFDIEAFFDIDFQEVIQINSDYRQLPKGIYGYTDSDKMECIISSELMESNQKRSIRFARSTMAHEVSHAIIHVPVFRKKKALLRSIHDDNHATLKMYRQGDIPVYKNPEWQAWRHAGALLMPTNTFKMLVMEGANAYEIADVFEVNPVFVETRARALKISIK